MATIYDAGISTKTTGALSQITGWTEVSPQVEIYDNDFIFSIATAGTAEFTTSAINIAGYNNIVLNVTEWYLPQDTLDDVIIYYSINEGAYIELYHAPRVDSFVARTYSIPTTGSTIRFRVTNLDNAAIGAEYKISSYIITGDIDMQIKDTPQQYEPVHNDLPFVVSGTSNTQSNYKYWCDVYFSGSTSYDYRLFTFPRPDGFGFFNLKTIIRDYVYGDLDIPTVETFYRNSDMYKAYSVYFGQSYGTSGTVTSGMASSGTYYAYDASLEWSEFIAYSQNDRAIRTTGQAKFLTNHPQSTSSDRSSYTRIGDSENAWIYMAVKQSNAVNKIYIETFDTNGSSLGFYTINNPYVLLSSDDNRFLRFPSGTANIPRIASADITVISGSLPIISSNVVYYEMATYSTSNAITSYGKMYKIESNCSKYNAYRIHYKNKWGGFDSFTFTLVNKEFGDIERKSYKKQYGSISSEGNWSYTKKDRGITNYSTKSKRRLRLTSDWITESEYELLIELLESSQVYWDDSGELHAVNVLTSSYEVKTLKNDKMFNLEIEVEFTQMNRRQ